jgi:hypothetical protein
LLFDNPFLDTSKTQDANLLFFNSLRGFSAFMKRPIKANTIISREHLRTHISTHLFMSLIRSIEAQSYLRFIYRNVFSKINLIQLIAFINEKEALHRAANGHVMEAASNMGRETTVAYN